MIPSLGWGDLYDVPKIQTVAGKKYDLRNDLTLQVGYMPKAFFSKYVTLGASFTHSFSDFTSWEVLNGFYTMELASGLKKDLIDGNGRDPNTFAISKFMGTTNLVLSPIYTKNLLFNSSIVYSQYSLVMGAGMANFNVSTVPVMDAGVIMKFFLNPSHILKFDFRFYKYLTSNSAISDNFNLVAGFAWNLGGTTDNKKYDEGEFNE
jgi:outer membrane beta-barrel protein